MNIQAKCIWIEIMQCDPKLLWTASHSAAQVSVGKITQEQYRRKVLGWLRGAPQLKLTIISEYQSDGEMTKLT